MARTNHLLLCLATLAVLGAARAAPRSGSEKESSPAELDPASAAALDAALAGAGRKRATRASAADRWLQLLADMASGGGADAVGEEGGAWFPRPIPLSLPIGRGNGKEPASLPLLILPVPVPAKTPTAQCSAKSESGDYKNYASQQSSGGYKQYPTPPRRLDHLQQEQVAPAAAAGNRASPSTTPTAQQPFSTRYVEEPTVPSLDYIVSSQQLVELFQAQVASNPELPPAVIPDYTAGDGTDTSTDAEAFTGEAAGEGSRRARLVRIRRYQLSSQFQLPGASPPSPPSPPAPFARSPSSPPSPPAPSPLEPPVPRFDRSLMLRGELTVPRAGYTEPYTVWWDATTGASRVDLHGGATSAYRMMLADGRTQGIEMRVERSGEGDVRRCAVATPRTPTTEDRALPGVPDLQDFSFAGYSEAEFGRVERWKRTVSGHPGEMGGARGEVLAFRHELLLVRAPDNYTATPLRYSVSVDSSVLGANCDGYVHRYKELREQRHDPALLALDLDESCEQVETTTRRDRVEPLREYTLPQRDPRYDTEYLEFKTDHKRRYMDDSEEAVRKNVLVQHSRFINSGNRQGATFNMEVNHLGDRLDAELAVLRGVREDAEGLPAEKFPHSRDQLAAMRGRLPRAFDWRDRGAVTHVRNQGSCSSCWAFAVAGSVEGALFVRTRRLVPLSEQCLVDCSQTHGGHGCGGTWPSAAYDYVVERGLPALGEYTPYQARVVTCLDARVPPVTHITTHVNVTRNSVQALKVAIRRHAPTVVIIDSTPKSFTFYKKGVLNDERCAKNKLEHAVLAVGWGERGGEPHFILKNSWSAAWGDAGYVRVAAAPNTCGVLTRPSYPRLEQSDVDNIPDAAVAAAANRD